MSFQRQLAMAGIDPNQSAEKIAEELLKLAVSPALAAELMAKATRGRVPLSVKSFMPHTNNGHALTSLVGHRPPPMPVSAVRSASPQGLAQILTPGARATPAELGTALRAKAKVQGAQQLAGAIPLPPVPAGLAGLTNAKIAGIRSYLQGKGREHADRAHKELNELETDELSYLDHERVPASKDGRRVGAALGAITGMRAGMTSRSLPGAALGVGLGALGGYGLGTGLDHLERWSRQSVRDKDVARGEDPKDRVRAAYHEARTTGMDDMAPASRILGGTYAGGAGAIAGGLLGMGLSRGSEKGTMIGAGLGALGGGFLGERAGKHFGTGFDERHMQLSSKHAAAPGELSRVLRNVGHGATLGTLAGGITGAASAEDGERLRGAGRGALIGAVGGGITGGIARHIDPRLNAAEAAARVSTDMKDFTKKMTEKVKSRGIRGASEGMELTAENLAKHLHDKKVTWEV